MPAFNTPKWGLNDTYRFIWSYFGGGRFPNGPARSFKRVRAGQRLSASSFHARCFQQARGFHDYFVQAVPPSSQHPERREKQYVRIPLVSAKHHFGVHTSRGERGYNEDTWQAGIINLPAFGDGRTHAPPKTPIVHDPDHPSNSVFFFGMYDGHGGDVCSKFLQQHLHDYLEATSKSFGLQQPPTPPKPISKLELQHLQGNLNDSWRQTVGGYFRRFKPDYDSAHDHLGNKVEKAKPRNIHEPQPPTFENLLAYSFLKADLDFISGEGLASYLSPKPIPTATSEDAHPEIWELQTALDDVNGSYTTPPLSSIKRSEVISFRGGSTCSMALVTMPEGENPDISFWHPQAEPTILTAHIGDTRILICDVGGTPYPLTTNHHPSLPSESKRLRRYAASFVTDSFGEERFGVLANTRAFGDVRQKRLGVSAEPEMCRVTVRHGGDFSFLVLMTDGISGTLSDQEVVDIVADSRTPDEGARQLVDYACTVTKEGDNASAMVVRLGGWEKRAPGDNTRDLRRYRKKEAEQVRSRRM
ncbi:hypothetical protein TWF694_008856 [Orbilia ellipsospora]|uniref:PPM-type phosphatase domain-containing protein n=1 Tax=Orbilia ellipsospora TaxID=2528407 RepID=A0AAV9XD49_9PEZI